MTNFEIKNKISNICALAAIPGSVLFPIWVILMYVVIPKGLYADFNSPSPLTSIVYNDILMCFVVFTYAVALLGLLVSTFTCGSLWRMFRTALKAGLAVIKAPSVIWLSLIFFAIWFGAAMAAFSAVLIAGTFCPAATIALSARNKRLEMACEY